MYTKLILVIILGYVAAEHENNIYIPLVKMGKCGSCDSDFDSSPGTMEHIEKMFNIILNRLDEISALIVRTDKSKPIDCGDIRKEGYNETGTYKIFSPGNEKGITVRCDMETSGGGWTVIQRRVSKSNFYKNWNEYETGFGNLGDNFYIGNRFLHNFTNQDRYMLRVDLTSFEDEKAYAEYSEFSVGDAESSYKLHVGGYKGTAGDALARQNGMEFSTYDRENDVWPKNCAVAFHGAWWYSDCHNANLNGEYGSKEFGKGTNWYQWKGYHVSMKTMEMKLRRKYN